MEPINLTRLEQICLRIFTSADALPKLVLVKALLKGIGKLRVSSTDVPVMNIVKVWVLKAICMKKR